MIPPDQTPRDAIANMVMEFRDEAENCRENAPAYYNSDQFTAWASRLERACQRLDAERGNWEVHSLRAALTDIANRPCFAELLGENKDDCWCPACTARVTLANTPVGAVPPAEQDTPQ